MGREIKRVPANFDWPIDKIWDGFVMPENIRPIPCDYCSRTGYNKETKETSDSFYGNGIRGSIDRWVCKITQDEVEALVKATRLIDFTHVWNGEEWVEKDPPYMPSADEVNSFNKTISMRGHDAINRMILIETRAKRLGIWGHCLRCDGQGEGWRNDKHHAAYDAWKKTPVPTGDWWQVWETVSEGAPVTPAFATAEELIDYLVKYGDRWDQNRGDGGWNRENAKRFVERGHAFSLITDSTGIIKTPRDC